MSFPSSKNPPLKGVFWGATTYGSWPPARGATEDLPGPFPLCIPGAERPLVASSASSSFAHLRQTCSSLPNLRDADRGTRGVPAQRRTLGLIPFFSSSLGDCHGAPNSRWPLASAALPV